METVKLVLMHSVDRLVIVAKETVDYVLWVLSALFSFILTLRRLQRFSLGFKQRFILVMQSGQS